MMVYVSIREFRVIFYGFCKKDTVSVRFPVKSDGYLFGMIQIFSEKNTFLVVNKREK